MEAVRPIRRALISVYDKTGLTELATGLAAAGVTIVSTGSTAARIAEAARMRRALGLPGGFEPMSSEDAEFMIDLMDTLLD